MLLRKSLLSCLRYSSLRNYVFPFNCTISRSGFYFKSDSIALDKYIQWAWDMFWQSQRWTEEIPLVCEATRAFKTLRVVRHIWLKGDRSPRTKKSLTGWMHFLRIVRGQGSTCDPSVQSNKEMVLQSRQPRIAYVRKLYLSRPLHIVWSFVFKIALTRYLKGILPTDRALFD